METILIMILGITLIVLALSVSIAAVSDVLKTENLDSGLKLMWTVVCCVALLVGPILWFSHSVPKKYNTK